MQQAWEFPSLIARTKYMNGGCSGKSITKPGVFQYMHAFFSKSVAFSTAALSISLKLAAVAFASSSSFSVLFHSLQRWVIVFFCCSFQTSMLQSSSTFAARLSAELLCGGLTNAATGQRATSFFDFFSSASSSSIRPSRAFSCWTYTSKCVCS